MVRKIACGHEQALQEGDVLLMLNNKLITRVSELDVMYDQEVLDALILRDREEIRIRVPTVPTEDLETDHVIIFCGAVLHRPHHAVRQQISKLHSEIYVSARVSSSRRLWSDSRCQQAHAIIVYGLTRISIRIGLDQLHHCR